MRVVALFLLCCCPLAAQAQAHSPITLTLQDAIARARQQGPAAQAARSARDAARWRDDAFNARLLPQLRLQGDAANLNRAINPIDLPDGSTQYISQAHNTTSLGLGFSQELPGSKLNLAHRLGGANVNILHDDMAADGPSRGAAFNATPVDVEPVGTRHAKGDQRRGQAQ